MLRIVIENKLHYEKSHLSFRCMLILSDDVFHGGCMGSSGSFRFHFTIKDQNERASKRLIRNFDEWTSHFYEEFPSIEISGKPTATDGIEKNINKVIINIFGREDKKQHLKQLKREISKEVIDYLVSILE